MTDINRYSLKKDPGTKGQVISIVVLALMMITIWYMLDLALLTFIITFILYNIVCKLQDWYRRVSRHGLPAILILIVVYIVFFLLLVLISVDLLPKVVQQISDLSSAILGFDYNKLIAALDPRVANLIKNVDVGKYIADMSGMISATATKVGHFSMNLFFALVLSFFLVSEKDAIRQFGERLESSKISFIYHYFMEFGGIFVRTFGNVMKVQVTIAFVNAVLSTILLLLMGFPSVIGLGFMIFCLGLVPVAGVIISLIPLCTIAFTIGGIAKIVQVLIMITLIHAMEAYILNPKLMANRVRLPVCFVFIILLVAEHYMGVWGLLIGVPIFIFLMAVLEVDYAVEKEIKKARPVKRH